MLGNPEQSETSPDETQEVDIVSLESSDQDQQPIREKVLHLLLVRFPAEHFNSFSFDLSIRQVRLLETFLAAPNRKINIQELLAREILTSRALKGSKKSLKTLIKNTNTKLKQAGIPAAVLCDQDDNFRLIYLIE